MRLSILFLVLFGAMCLNVGHTEAKRATTRDKTLFYQSVKNDQGHVKNCGTAKMDITWAPKDIDPKGSLKLDYSFTFPVKFENGRFDIDAVIQGTPMKYSIPVHCSQLAVLNVTCPAKESQNVHGSQIVPNLEVLGSYSGPASATVKLYNSDEKLVFCGKAQTNIKDIKP